MNRSTTPAVGYSYSDGTGNHVRLTGITYPNGRLLRYEYRSGADHAMGRVSFLADDESGQTGQHLAEYAYLGLRSFVRTTYPEPQLRCDLAHGTGSDPYAGLDPFGRVIDLRWHNTATQTDVVRIGHGYDRAGNRLWRADPVAAAANQKFDELYSYDAMNQLAALQRGLLDGQKTGLESSSKMLAEDWSLDMTGNWSQYRQDVDGDGTWDLDQSRTHNAANEILTLGGIGTHVAHDRAGNMTRIPKPDDWSAHFDITYDAWNRLVRVADGVSTIVEYQYDGRSYRTVKKTYAGGELDTTRHFYYSSQWQVLEERLGESESADRQFVWGLRYIDDIVLRDRDVQGYGALDERLYGLQDPNWNVAALATAVGTIAQRYAYKAYGQAACYDNAWSAQSPALYDNGILFTGRTLDAESGLYHYRAREYHPTVGRFVARDPIGNQGRDGNFYRYASGRPPVVVDPRGLLSVSLVSGNQFTAKCGTSVFVRWRFDLDADAPCEGYFIQHIKVFSVSANCKGDYCPCDLPRDVESFTAPTNEFWEAFYVARGKRVTALQETAGYTDQWKDTTAKRKCSESLTRAAVRFYCEHENVLPGGNVGTGVLDRSTWPPVPGSGNLPSTRSEPAFWHRPAVEGPTARGVYISCWCCMPDGSGSIIWGWA